MGDEPEDRDEPVPREDDSAPDAGGESGADVEAPDPASGGTETGTASDGADERDQDGADTGDGEGDGGGDVAGGDMADGEDVTDGDAENADVDNADADGEDAETGANTGGDGDEITSADAGGNTSVATDGAYSTDYEVHDGPAEDEEMPLADHIEEMIRRLAIVLAIAGVVTVAAYPASERLIEFLWQSYIPNPGGNRPVVYGPLEYIFTKLQVAALSGLVVGLPVFVYQSYRFMRPGLYPHERRYYLASVPTSLVLAVLGVTFAHFVVLPLTFLYFTSYTENAAVVAFGLRETFNLIVLMMGYMAIVFQIPLFIMLAIMMNLVSRRWLENKRLLFWAAFGGLSFTFVAVDPTGMAPIVIALTMILLFELTLLLLRWTGN